MDYSYILNTSLPQKDKLLAFGFSEISETKGSLVLRKEIAGGQFYHMNKKYWITVLLTAVTDFEKLCELTKKSYALVQK